jgi:hypothetical protein
VANNFANRGATAFLAAVGILGAGAAITPARAEDVAVSQPALAISSIEQIAKADKEVQTALDALLYIDSRVQTHLIT